MTTKLYEWLRNEFYRSNHSKYKHLFEVWISNITKSQIDSFNKQMYWDAANNNLHADVFTGSLVGNATTATNATNADKVDG